MKHQKPKSKSREVQYYFFAPITLGMSGQRLYKGHWYSCETEEEQKIHKLYYENKEKAYKLFDRAVANNVINSTYCFKDYGRNYGQALHIWFSGNPGEELRSFIASLKEWFPTMQPGNEPSD